MKKKTDRGEKLSIESNRYLDEWMIRHLNCFRVLGILLPLILAAGGWFTLWADPASGVGVMLLFAAPVGLLCSIYLFFGKCVADEEGIQKRVILPLKKVRWEEVTRIQLIQSSGMKKRVLQIYGGDKRLMRFESPNVGMDEALLLAKKKGVPVERLRD